MVAGLSRRFCSAQATPDTTQGRSHRGQGVAFVFCVENRPCKVVGHAWALQARSRALATHNQHVDAGPGSPECGARRPGGCPACRAACQGGQGREENGNIIKRPFVVATATCMLSASPPPARLIPTCRLPPLPPLQPCCAHPLRASACLKLQQAARSSAPRWAPQQQSRRRRQQLAAAPRLSVVAVAAPAGDVSVQEEKLDGAGMRLHVSVSAEQCQKAYSKLMKELREGTTVQGFRKGKVRWGPHPRVPPAVCCGYVAIRRCGAWTCSHCAEYINCPAMQLHVRPASQPPTPRPPCPCCLLPGARCRADCARGRRAARVQQRAVRDAGAAGGPGGWQALGGPAA